MLSRIARSLIIHRSNIVRNPIDLSAQQFVHRRHHATLRLSSCKKFLVVDEPKRQLQQSKFPLVWLRDNCQCRQCFHPEVNRRILDWTQFEFDQQLKSFTVSGGRCQLDVFDARFLTEIKCKFSVA